MGTTASPRKRPARERLLDTADRLFYDEGVHTVGIDRVLEQSGVAKGSLYYNLNRGALAVPVEMEPNSQ